MAPPETGRVNVTQLANRFNEEIQAEISTGLAAGLARPRLVGFLANDDAGWYHPHLNASRVSSCKCQSI